MGRWVSQPIRPLDIDRSANHTYHHHPNPTTHRASSSPCSVSGVSHQPMKRLLRFHVDCPCRTKITCVVMCMEDRPTDPFQFIVYPISIDSTRLAGSLTSCAGTAAGAATCTCCG